MDDVKRKVIDHVNDTGYGNNGKIEELEAALDQLISFTGLLVQTLNKKGVVVDDELQVILDEFNWRL